MKINEKLIWDYEFNAKERQRDPFRRWYLVRVLTHGGIDDIRAVGLKIIHDELPRLFLPKKILGFWQWFFSLPEIKSRYGNLDSPPKNLHP